MEVLNAQPPGSFVVRKSSRAGRFALSVRVADGVDCWNALIADTGNGRCQ